MDIDDLEPRRTQPKPRDLDSLSVEELRDCAATLKAEIVRIEAKIAAKQAHLSGAGGLFKKG